MTVYELISLQAPFEKLCKINPDVSVNVCITKRQRPTLPIKVSLSFIMQIIKVMVTTATLHFALVLLYNNLYVDVH